MKNPKIVKEWLKKAEDDLEMAMRATRGKKKMYWVTGYHAQQSAEKLLKAFLIAGDKEPERTHNLVKILKEYKMLEPKFTFLEGYAEFLTPFAAEIRYPTDLQLSAQHARKALKSAKEIKDFVVGRIHWNNDRTNERACKTHEVFELMTINVQ